MHDKMQIRLQQLRSEYEAGQTMLAEMETKQASLERTLLRIMGAIQVLEELLTAEAEPKSDDSELIQSSESIGSGEDSNNPQQVNASHE